MDRTAGATHGDSRVQLVGNGSQKRGVRRIWVSQLKSTYREIAVHPGGGCNQKGVGAEEKLLICKKKKRG